MNVRFLGLLFLFSILPGKCMAEDSSNLPPAEVVELPEIERPAKKREAPLAEIVPLPALPMKKSAASIALPNAIRAREPGYPTVLSGCLYGDMTLDAEHSPVLVRGNLIVPEGVTLRIKAGTLIHLRADPGGSRYAWNGAPDPSQSAVIWVFGSCNIEGITGNPAEIVNQEKDSAFMMLYGGAQNKLDGARLKNIAVAQSGGASLWTNCEFVGARHYALARGAGTFTHCTFRDCGGIFAAYHAGPWSLLARKNLFDGCREGILIGSDPGAGRLLIEKNNFVHSHGAVLRAMSAAAVATNAKAMEFELLIGENFYGSASDEEVDRRIVDHRTDRTVHAMLNTRPPAERPYTDAGAGIPANVIAATQKEQQSALQKIIQGHVPQPAKAQEKIQTSMAAPHNSLHY